MRGISPRPQAPGPRPQALLIMRWQRSEGCGCCWSLELLELELIPAAAPSSVQQQQQQLPGARASPQAATVQAARGQRPSIWSPALIPRRPRPGPARPRRGRHGVHWHTVRKIRPKTTLFYLQNILFCSECCRFFLKKTMICRSCTKKSSAKKYVVILRNVCHNGTMFVVTERYFSFVWKRHSSFRDDNDS